MNASTRLATWVLDELVARGLTDAVLCPGSRNAPLSFALAADPRIRLHTRIDERTAAFLALGLTKSSHRPVAVVTTSGTATANLHPAVLEAAHAGLELVAVTADRPERMRGTGANQTTDQVRLFGTAAGFADLTEPDGDLLAGAWFPGGPVHLNVQLDEPLLPGSEPSPATAVSSGLDMPSPDTVAEPHHLRAGPRTVVVAGDDAGPPARVLAEQAGWPLLAEPSSGSRTGHNPIRTYRLLLGTALGERVERVVVFGHPTLSRPVQRLLARSDVEVVSVPARGRWAARPFPVASEHTRLTADADDRTWLEEWRSADRTLSARVDEYVAGRPGLTPYDVAAVVDATNPPRGLLVVGASSPVRDLDLMATAHPVGERRMVLANRGLAGIDGTISTAVGAALGRPHSSRAVAYVGDVTFLHDLTGLVLGPEEQRPPLTIVVANDDGGSIFATLEQGAEEYAGHYERLFGTPHGVDLSPVCAGLGVPHVRVAARESLLEALVRPVEGIQVVEAVIGRADRRETDLAIAALAT